MNCIALFLAEHNHWCNQVSLDNALVPPEKRLNNKKCNARIEFSKPQREETYQVTLDALKLSLCYPAFLITAEVPKVYMHQFWNSIQKIKDTDAYRFKLDKKKLWVDTKVFCEIRLICLILPNQEFVEPPSEDELEHDQFYTIRDDTLLGTLKFVSKTQDYQQYGALILDDMINQDIKDYKAYKTCLDFATRKSTPKKARKFMKVASFSRKLYPVLVEEPAVKPKRAKRHAKKSTTMPTASVVIRDTPSESVPKKKTPAKVDRGKGMDLLSDVASLKAAQFKKTLNKSKLELTSSCNYSLMNNDEERVYEEEYVHTFNGVEFTDDDEEYEELYKDVNVRLQATEHEEEGKRDEEMIDAGRDECTQHTTYEQVKDDEHNLDNDPPTATEVIFYTNVKVLHEEPNREDKDKDKDPPAGSDQGLKKRKTSNNAKPLRGSKSKESKSSLSKGSKSQPKSSGKSAQAEEPVFETADTEMPLNQGEDLDNTDDQPNVKATSKDDWFKKPERPSTPDSDWNKTKQLVLDHLRLGYAKFAKKKISLLLLTS
ncbi:hypothetical protein Tco_0719634 [Tanacetum coccineum]